MCSHFKTLAASWTQRLVNHSYPEIPSRFISNHTYRCNWDCGNTDYCSETRHQLKSREISPVHHIHFCCPIVLKICTEHGCITAVRCSKRLDNLRIKFKRDFATIEYNISFGGISYIATTPLCLSLKFSWWRHQMETFSALHAICTGNSQSEVNNREAGDLRRPSRPLWRHSNVPETPAWQLPLSEL